MTGPVASRARRRAQSTPPDEAPLWCERDGGALRARTGSGLEHPRRRDTRLDHYVDRYAARTHGMTASAIRALFAVANRPEVVSLAGGMPNIADLPLDVVGSTPGAAGADRRPAGHAVRLRPGRAGDPRRHLRGDEARGHRRPSRRRDRDRRLAAGPRPGHPDLLRPGRRRAGRGAELCRRARRVPVLPVRGRPRRHGRVRAGPVGAQPGDHHPAPRRPYGQVPLHDPQPPEPGRRHPDPGAPDRAPRRSTERADLLVVEDNPYGLLGFDADPHPGHAVDERQARGLPRARSPRPSPPASGWAGCWRRTPSGRS